MPLLRPSSNPTAGAVTTLLGLLLLASTSAPGAARADCATSGTIVTCSGADIDGFDAGMASDLAVEIESGASVSNVAGDAIRLNDGSSVVVHSTGSITRIGGTGIRFGADGNLDNSGTIEATTAIESAFGGHSILNSGTLTGAISLGDGDQTLDNPGMLTGDITLGNGDDFVANTGTLTGDILAGEGDDILANAGTFVGTADLGDGDDIFRVADASSVTGTVDGGDQDTADRVVLIGGLPGSFDLDSVSNFEELVLRSGPWTLRETGDFSGGATVRAGATLVVDGSSLTGPNGATTLNGDLLLEDGSNLRASIDASGDQGHLIVNGAVTTTGSVALDIVQLAPVPSTTTFELISATSIGSFQLPTLIDTPFVEFEIVQTASDLDLVVTRLSSYAAVGASVNQTSVGANLDAILAAGPTGDLAALIGEIDQLSSSEARRAFDSLHPEAYDAHTSTTLSLGSAIADLVTRDRVRCDRDYRFQLRGVDRTQLNPCGPNRRRLWADALFSFASRDPARRHIDYDTTGGALLFGGDVDVADWLVSGFAGATTATIDIQHVGSGDSYSFELGAAARRSFGAARIQTVALYGHGWHTQERAIRTGTPRGNAHGEFQSDRFLSRTELSYVFEFAGFELTPLTDLEWVYLGEDSFRETGAGAASLAVGERRTSLLRSGIGARIAYEEFKYYWLGRWLAWSDGTWRGEIHGRWLRTWKGAQRKLHGSFVDAPSGVGSFRSTGQDVEQAMAFGGRLTFQPLLYAAVIGLGYDFQIGDDTTVLRAAADVRIPF